MKFSSKFISILIVSIWLSLLNTVAVFAAEKPMVSIVQDSAVAEVIRAKRKGDIVEIEVRFNTVVEPFSGAIIYDKLDRNTIFISNGNEKWQLTGDDDAAPQDLKLNFSYDMTKTPRVGQWKGKFIAPPADINELSLHISGLPVIDHIIVK